MVELGLCFLKTPLRLAFNFQVLAKLPTTTVFCHVQGEGGSFFSHEKNILLENRKYWVLPIVLSLIN